MMELSLSVIRIGHVTGIRVAMRIFQHVKFHVILEE